MKHVIYHTDYFDSNGQFLREEENEAYFNTLPSDFNCFERIAFNGCRLLNPAHRECHLSKEQLECLKSKKPGYELKYVSIYDVDDGNRAIYAIYEKMIPDEKSKAIYSASVEIGEENNGVSFAMDVFPTDYDLSYDEHITRWDGVRCAGTDILPTDDWISFCESSDAAKDRHVTIVHGNLSMFGICEKMIRKNKFVTEYHCRNSLFPFIINLNTALTPEDWNEIEEA